MRVTHKSIIAIILVSLVAFLGSFSIVRAPVQLTLLHRWFFSNNVDNVDHCFTTGQSALGSGYVYDDFTCYVATTQIPNTTPLYQWWNSKTSDHFYTTDPTGELAPISEPGPYVYEGIACYVWTGLPPVASFTYSPENPVVGEEIVFDASSAYDPDGGVVNYSWDFDASDGIQADAEGEVVSHNYSEAGEYTVILTVTDDNDMINTTTHKVPALIPVQYNLTIHSSAGGSVTTPGEGTYVYDAGAVVDLVAEPDEGYRFIM